MTPDATDLAMARIILDQSRAEHKELILGGNAFRLLRMAEGPSTWEFR